MPRLILSFILLAALAAPVMARPSTLSMTCQQAQNLVLRQGAIVMTTGRHTYARFVVDAGFCEVAEWAESARRADEGHAGLSARLRLHDHAAHLVGLKYGD